MSTGYLPTTDDALLSFTNNFRTLLSLNWSAYGLLEPVATNYATKQNLFATRLQEAQNPDSRGKRTVFLKNESKKELIKLTRDLGRQINNTTTVTDEQRQELGLTVRKTHPTPVPAPTTSPKIDVVKVSGQEFTLRLSDSERPNSKARPAGTIGFTLMTYIGETPSMDVQDWTLQGNRGKPTKFVVDFEQTLEPGTKVWFSAFWYNARGQSGPATEPVSAVVQFGGMSKGTIQSSEPKARKAA